VGAGRGYGFGPHTKELPPDSTTLSPNITKNAKTPYTEMLYFPSPSIVVPFSPLTAWTRPSHIFPRNCRTSPPWFAVRSYFPNSYPSFSKPAFFLPILFSECGTSTLSFPLTRRPPHTSFQDAFLSSLTHAFTLPCLRFLPSKHLP